MTTADQTWVIGSFLLGGMHIAAVPWGDLAVGQHQHLIGAAEYRGIIWPPRQDHEQFGLIPYIAATRWKPPPQEDEPEEDESAPAAAEG